MTCILVAGFFWLQVVTPNGTDAYIKVANIDTIYDTNQHHVINANSDLVASPISAKEIMEVLKTCEQIPKPNQ